MGSSELKREEDGFSLEVKILEALEETEAAGIEGDDAGSRLAEEEKGVNRRVDGQSHDQFQILNVRAGPLESREDHGLTN